MSTPNEANDVYQDRRKAHRKTVLLKSSVQISGFTFDAVVYDLSLYGAKIKLKLPLSTETLLMIRIKETQYVPARVAWAKDDFIGLEFRRSPERIKSILGNLGDKLE